ncbi:DUF481 domain-containing protein [Flavobacteriaceae bacterium TP-CH-4]|uniref:DUF481 domain-containing protein n=1 Tax=Pelagihabitans pacificus TaxID=2696054 RepID=A0A967AU27_9FLAO|nr:DUF481 domain-containing protein [Pelagihabitans pacificus]NHF59947.1 DUF481 domain-containing protein [Pelagihabitans pacificus]
MKILRVMFWLCLLVGGLSHLRAQLVNIESKRMQRDSVRLTLKSDLLFNYTDNNGNYILQIGSNLTTQLKSKDLKKIYFFIGNYNLIRTRDEDFQNSWFFHFRYNQKLSDLWRLEAFLQNQNNERLIITSRNLIGAGVRLKLVSEEKTKVYFGNAYMYETERIAATGQEFYNHRNSSYLSVNQALEKPRIDFTGTVYFQPLYRTISNHRVLCELKAEVPITQVVSLSALYNYFFSSFLPNSENDRSSNLRVGLTFTL